MEFSIEVEAENIHNSNVKSYFQEVVTSYVSGNYRSATVMLWTVVICDLVYKLKDLKDIFSDDTADDILKKNEKMQSDDPESPTWEITLIKEVKKRTELLDNGEYQQILYLQKERHLSAHPVLSNMDLLYKPNRETVRALIRNVLEGVLVKPPLLTHKIEKHFLENINKNHLTDVNQLEKYIVSAYLTNLKPAIQNHLFKTIWKLTFNLVNLECDENRDINLNILAILYKRRSFDIQSYISKETIYFSTINSELLHYLIDFLMSYPILYKNLSNNVQVLIEEEAKGVFEIFVRANFLSASLSDHLENIYSYIDENLYSAFDNSVVSLNRVGRYWNSHKYLPN